MKRAPRWSLLVALAASGPGLAAAKPYCPSYQRGTTDGRHHCGVKAFAGQEPTRAEWKAFFALAAMGPKQWKQRGPLIPDLNAGCGALGGQEKKVAAHFPPEVLKAMAIKESSWRHFCSPTEPGSEKDKAAQTLISRDCGFGVSQVTSGMREGETAAFDRERVASDPFYNLATGASILAAKWQSARCLATRDPEVVEHWYVALWKYNGYSYSNDPSNPIFSSTRGVYDPAVGGLAPYQEKVFGIIEKGSKKGQLWKPIELAYPRIEDVAGRRSEPVKTIECSSPTDCTRKRGTHRSVANPDEAASLLETPPVVRPAADGSTGGQADGGGSRTTGGSDAGGTAREAPKPGGGCGCIAAPGAPLPLWTVGLLVGLLSRTRGRRR